MKIMLPYIIVAVGYAFVHVGYFKRVTLTEYLWEHSLISFFVDAALRIWFVAAILFLYGIFPALYYGLRRSTRGFFFGCCIVFVMCFTLSCLSLNREITIINEIFISRIPAFMLGMIIGKLLKENEQPSLPLCIIWSGFAALTIVIIWVIMSGIINWWTVARLLFAPFVLLGMLLLGRGMDKKKPGGTSDKLLIFLGGITFELFLLHDKVLETINAFLYLFDDNPTAITLCANVLAIGLSVLGAWILQRIVSLLAMGRKKMKAA